MRLRTLIIVAGLALSGCVGAPSESASPTAKQSSYAPVTVTNCGFQVTLTEPPKAAVTLNQGATEVMLSLGLEKQMVGTAYRDDQIAGRWQAAYDSIKVLADKYPSKEAFLQVKPDFAYASYSSAFTPKNVGTREELRDEKIATYLSPAACPDRDKTVPHTIDSAWAEATEVARIFGVEDRAAQVIGQQKTELEAVRKQAAGKGKKVFWFDSGTEQAYAGVGGGGPQIIIDSVGATNVFADMKSSSWENVSWERVVQADPDVIVLAEASWSTVESKKNRLESDPVLSQLKAVKNKAYITISFAESTPGMRLVDGAKTVSDQIAKL